MFYVPKHWKYEDKRHAGYLKNTVDGYSFVQSHSYHDVLIKHGMGSFKYVVGHNRAATLGGLTLRATHPFQEGPITLVHNGTLNTTNNLPIAEYDVKAANDSHTIAHNLANYDAEEIISKLNGAFALVWHDARDDTLNIVRNAKRPLHMSKSYTSETIYFASEGEMLHWLDSRLQLNLQEIVQPKVGYYMKFYPDDLMQPVVKEIELLKPAYGGNYGGLDDADWWNSYRDEGTHFLPHKNTKEETSGPFVPTSSRTESTSTPITIPHNNGKGSAVPTKLQEDLLELDLLVEDVLCFVPQDADAVTEKNGELTRETLTVHGYLLLNDRTHVAHCSPAITYGVKPSVWEHCNWRIWTVRPLGVKKTAKGDSLIVCRFGHSMTPDHRISKLPNTLEDVLPIQDTEVPWTTDIAKQGDDYMVPGPDGTLVSEEHFNHLTRHGCIDCGGNVETSEAYDILWVNEGRDPMCPSCVEDYNLKNKGA